MKGPPPNIAIEAQKELAKRELARRNFYDFVKYRFPNGHFDEFHDKYYKLLSLFAERIIKRLIISMPPQHGKSEGSTRHLPTYLLGTRPNENIVIGSYSQKQARRFNRRIQRLLDEQSYKNVFPKARIAAPGVTNTGALRNADDTELLDSEGNIKVVGRGAGITGNPADVIILDDVYKDLAEANSPVIREGTIDWYKGSIDTRAHNDTQRLIVFTRWHEEDLVGFICQTEQVIDITDIDDIENIPILETTWLRINFPALQNRQSSPVDPRAEGEALWPQKHSADKLRRTQAQDPFIFEALYQGNPKPAEGMLYKSFDTYKSIPESLGRYAYTDTADKGTDYLCTIFFDLGIDKYLYIHDIMYTDEGMEITEPEQAARLVLNKTRKNRIESNNGGAGFLRAVKRYLEKVKYVGCYLEEWPQQANKESRILSNATIVQERVKMPEDWITRWPKFANAVLTFRRNFKANEHDDGPDALTGCVEMSGILDGEEITFTTLGNVY